jgi:hypothetical protein
MTRAAEAHRLLEGGQVHDKLLLTASTEFAEATE